jgi:hypothetical protein
MHFFGHDSTLFLCVATIIVFFCLPLYLSVISRPERGFLSVHSKALHEHNLKTLIFLPVVWWYRSLMTGCERDKYRTQWDQ